MECIALLSARTKQTVLCSLPYFTMIFAIQLDCWVLWQINLVSLLSDVVGAQQIHSIALRMTTVHISSAWLLFYGQPL
jgi:hypothetical protein